MPNNKPKIKKSEIDALKASYNENTDVARRALAGALSDREALRELTGKFLNQQSENEIHSALQASYRAQTFAGFPGDVA